MQFRTLAVLYLSGVASAAAIAPRADFGYWDFEGSASFPVSGYTSYRVAATYHNSELSDAIDITCTYLYNPTTKTETASCTDPSFSYDFGGVRMANTISNVTLKQTVGLWGEMVTVFGTKEFDWDFSSGSGRSGTAEGKIEVTSAIA